jgi:hypothetical protein
MKGHCKTLFSVQGDKSDKQKKWANDERGSRGGSKEHVGGSTEYEEA